MSPKKSGRALPSPRSQQSIAVLQFLEECTGAPPDWPHAASAQKVVLQALNALAKVHIELKGLVERLEREIQSNGGQEEPSRRNVLLGRRAAHQLYSSLLKIARLSVIDPAHWHQVLTVLGAWMVRRYLVQLEPKASSLRALVLALGPQGISSKALDRMQAKALAAMRAALEEQPAKAAAIGLQAVDGLQRTPVDESEKFRIELERRFAQLIEYAPQRSVQGVWGHGALSLAGLKQAGEFLRLRVEAGEDDGLTLCLQVLTWLTPALLNRLPVVMEMPKQELPVWINLNDGIYNYRLSLVTSVKVDVAPATSALYYPAQGVVSIPLPDFLLKALKQRYRVRGSMALLSDLIEVEGINPRTSIQESAGYRITLRRVQESIAPALLAAGHHRWPVALATSAFMLVSRGRRVYSVCSAERVWEVSHAAHRALGWQSRSQPKPAAVVYFGSSVSPKPEAISKVLAFLTSQCENRAHTLDLDWLGWVAARTAFVLSLCLALRHSIVYPVDWVALAVSESISFVDKEVHREPCEPVPVVCHLRTAMLEWNEAVALVLAYLETHGTGQDARAVEALKSQEVQGKYPLVEVLAQVVWQPAGADTWRARLPPSLRLEANFARHFWPWALERQGAPQKLVDLLMRHQTEYLPQSGLDVHAPSARQRSKLREAMEVILNDIWQKAGCH